MLRTRTFISYEVRHASDQISAGLFPTGLSNGKILSENPPKRAAFPWIFKNYFLKGKAFRERSRRSLPRSDSVRVFSGPYQTLRMQHSRHQFEIPSELMNRVTLDQSLILLRSIWFEKWFKIYVAYNMRLISVGDSVYLNLKVWQYI